MVACRVAAQSPTSSPIRHRPISACERHNSRHCALAKPTRSGPRFDLPLGGSDLRIHRPDSGQRPYHAVSHNHGYPRSNPGRTRRPLLPLHGFPPRKRKGTASEGAAGRCAAGLLSAVRPSPRQPSVLTLTSCCAQNRRAIAVGLFF